MKKMGNKKTTCSIAIICCCSLLLMPFVAGSTLETKPLQQDVVEGDIIEIEIYASLDVPANTVAVNFTFWDPSIVTLEDISIGDFMDDAIVSLMGTSTDNEIGVLRDIVLCSSNGRNYSGVIATLTFKAVNDGVAGVYIPEFAVAYGGVHVCSPTIHSFDISSEDVDDELENKPTPSNGGKVETEDNEKPPEPEVDEVIETDTFDEPIEGERTEEEPFFDHIIADKPVAPSTNNDMSVIFEKRDATYVYLFFMMGLLSGVVLIMLITYMKEGRKE